MGLKLNPLGLSYKGLRKALSKALGTLVLILLILLAIYQPILLRVSDVVQGPWSSLPLAKRPKGEWQLKGLKAEVQVCWDLYGVPHIYAESEEDLALSFGFIQAYDRLFQMDLARRLASGRLSELFGNVTYSTDVFYRVVGLRRAAEETWIYMKRRPELSKHVAILEAFSLGVNQFIEWAKSSRRAPVEYSFLGVSPEPWTPVDTLAIAKLIAWSLAGDLLDLELAKLVSVHGVQILLELEFLTRPLNTRILQEPLKTEPSRPNANYGLGQDVRRLNLDVPQAVLRWAEEARSFTKALIGEGFSNNWVISGRLTDTEYPILANDPHLALQAPPVWYEAHLNVKGMMNVRGVTFPGVPLIVIGRNDYVAWGFTNVGADVVDFYYYIWNGDKYYYRDRWIEVERVWEKVLVKIGDRLEERLIVINITVHGPLVERNGERYALKWTGHEVTLEFVSIYLMNLAKDVYDFIEAQRYFAVPAQNAVFADVYGNIAYSPAGRYPVRSPTPAIFVSDDALYNTGFLPFNGSASEGEWEYYIPWDELPRVVNPERGYVVTANNAPVGGWYKYYLGWRWADRFRYDRIVEMIGEALRLKGKIVVADVAKIQLDVKSLAALMVRDLLLEAYSRKPKLFQGELEEAIAMLKDWDGFMSINSSEAVLSYFLMLKVHEVVWKDWLEAAGLSLTFLPFEFTELVLKGAFDGEIRFLKLLKISPEEVMAKALSNALSEVKLRLGADKKAWRWGDVHVYVLKHPLGIVLPWLNYPIKPAPGDLFTVNVAPWLEVQSGPSVRFIADMRPEATGLIALPGGNSGHPLSPHYLDQLDMWVEGLYKELTMPLKLEELKVYEALITFKP